MSRPTKCLARSGPQDPAFTETTPYAPNSPYAASKAGSDMLVRAYQHTYGLSTTTSNCSNNYGPYQFPEKLIPLFVIRCLEGGPLPIYGDGMNVRDWLFVEDHCRGIEAVLERGAEGETYNIGGRCELPNLAVIDTIVQRRRRGLCARPAAARALSEEPGRARRELRGTQDLRHRPSRARSPLCHRPAQDRGGARLHAGLPVRVGAGPHGGVVPGERVLVAGDPDQRVPQVGRGQLCPPGLTARARSPGSPIW